MTPTPRALPPTAAPIGAVDLARGLRGALAGGVTLERLGEAVRACFGVPHVRFTGSGRAALSVALTALARLSPRRRVVVPAYTSFSVPAAVVRAGLAVTLCDVDPRTLDLDLDELERLVGDDTLAVVPNHLFGFPGDLAGATSIARRHGAFVVEDAAQAAGARYRGRPAGTCGDAGVYSLGRGKNVTAGQGGIVVTGSAEIARAIDEVPLTPPPRSALAELAETAALALLVRPGLFWIPERAPGFDLAVSAFAPDFALEELSPFRAGLARAMLVRLADLTAARRRTAAAYARALDGSALVEPIAPVGGADPCYLRYPVLARDGESCQALVAALKARGLGAASPYPNSLGEIAALAPFVAPRHERLGGAREAAARLLTLPTHPFVSARDVARIADLLTGPRARAALAPRAMVFRA